MFWERTPRPHDFWVTCPSERNTSWEEASDGSLTSDWPAGLLEKNQLRFAEGIPRIRILGMLKTDFRAGLVRKEC